MTTTRSTRILTLGAGLILAASLAACGGSSSHANTATSPTTAGNTTSGNGTGSNNSNGNGGGTFPGASGSVAAITGSSMEVQNQQTGQVTVSWTSSTTFSKTVTLSAANVAAGDCVTVTGSTSTGTLVANNVTVSKSTSSGSCTGNFGAGRPGGGSGFPGGTRPNGGSRPSIPSGSAPRGASGFSFASGKVTSITPSSMVIYGISSSGFGGSRSTQGSTPPTSIPSTNVKIELQSSTTYSETQSTAASSLAVGDCVSAVGSTDSTGAVSARTVRITSTGGQTCSSGFGGFAGGGAANG